MITAAGKNQRSLPLQKLVDRDGKSKSVLAILASEIIEAGIQKIAVIVWPGDEAAYAEASGEYAQNITFIPQEHPRGYGHAVSCAAEFTGNDSFLLMVGDHLYISEGEKSCTAQLLAIAEKTKCPVSAVQATHESQLPYYGAIRATRTQSAENLFEVEAVVEKPTPTEAEQRLVVPGLRAGNYLCFFGMHVLTPDVMKVLSGGIDDGAHLSDALQTIANRERLMAYEIAGRRLDIDLHYGLLRAQIALGLDGDERDEVLSLLAEQLVQSKS